VVDEQEPIRDARRIRALSHPLRIELLELLGDGELTATQCAELTGESPANCSFHLRTLAKYGFIEPAERSGRERPWRRSAAAAHTVATPDFDDPASVRAVGELARIAVDRAVDGVRLWIDAAADEPPEWMDASLVSSSGVWVTRDELEELSTAVRHLTDRFADREQDPTRRPAGARPARLFAVAAPDVARERRHGRTGDPTGGDAS
jgi:DNA-binding transcriptional ArsR family regulator